MYIIHACSVTNSLFKNLVNILVFGLFIAFRDVEAAEECYFDKKGMKYCQYGCCEDGCCPMSKAAIAGLIIGTMFGVISLVGCFVCMCWFFQQQDNSNRNAMVLPVRHSVNKVYVHNSASYSSSSDHSSSYSESSNTHHKPNVHSFRKTQSDQKSSPSYKHSEPRPAKY